MLKAMLNQIRGLLQEREPQMMALLARLVEQSSFTEDVPSTSRLVSLLETELASIRGLFVRRVPSARFAPHLVASTRSARDTSVGAIALVGHSDTVFPPGTFEGFRREGDLARGPGVLDMKGGLVVAAEALRALSTLGVLDSVPVRLAVVSDEELGSPEGRCVIADELVGARCALVLEAGRASDLVVTARKGTGRATVRATGKVAHAGNAHHLGANAIWALARFIDAAQSLTDYGRGVTVNVGTVHGGTAKNTVPDRAEALLDFRFVTRADGEATLRALEIAAREAALPGATVTVDAELARAPLERSLANVDLYREYAAHARAAGLAAGEAPLCGGGSDASTTAALGIPSIDGLGPRGEGFHTTEELVEVASMVPKAEALARFIAARAT